MFQPAPGNYGIGISGALLDSANTKTALVDKNEFTQGLALGHAFLLFSFFIPQVMLCMQIASNDDVQQFIGTGIAQLGQYAIILILLLPLAHLVVRLTPWALVLSIWVPAFGFCSIGWYYWNQTYGTVAALQSRDCTGFPIKADLQMSYDGALELYNTCSGLITSSIEDCPHYQSLWENSPEQFNYLRSLEHRFQCAGMCASARRLWQLPGAAAPACSLFVAEWVRGAESSAQFILWYSVVLIVASIPVFIMMLDTFFKDYYDPLLGLSK
jgi:hypothetical protein